MNACKFSLLLIGPLLSSCTTTLTKEGREVTLVTESQKEKYCEMIDIITTSNDMGWDTAEDRENAMNEARNKVAKIGGNGMRIISSDSIISGLLKTGNVLTAQSQAIVQVEALRCKF
ncbi:MAG: hypothetical protein CL678_16115 [Bdellovibrionaceae bacterium]|nr:hypothetical protein [Pseudobdellovibrionaceae bacterium]|tara:strand:- start:1789 stop:2139 length:351 start_codon:yes stop_codon:yes gene_type:complete